MSVLAKGNYMYIPDCKNIFILIVCLLICTFTNPVAANTSLAGHWLIDKKASDSPDVALKKKFRKSKPGQRRPRGMRDPTAKPADTALGNYWRTLNDGQERRASKNLRRVGTAYPLITFEELQIDNLENYDGFVFNYEKSLPREVFPNPNGRIYTAKGDELVSDEIGHTLSYWDGSSLLLETDSPTGGRYLEELKLSKANNQLQYRVTLDLPILTETVEVRKIFKRAN